MLEYEKYTSLLRDENLKITHILLLNRVPIDYMRFDNIFVYCCAEYEAQIMLIL